MTTATVGDATEATIEVTGETIDEFARLSGDDNPLHLDDEYAARTMFGERVAHGALTASVVSAALTKHAGLTIFLSQDLRFENPVFVGDELTARTEVVEDLGEGRLRVEVSARTEDERVASGEVVILVREEPEIGETGGTDEPSDADEPGE